jgi:hypothetical protein
MVVDDSDVPSAKARATMIVVQGQLVG